MASVNLVCCVR